MQDVHFRHETIDERPPCERLGFCMTADLTGNGRDDVIVGGAGSSYPARRFVTRAGQRATAAVAGLRTALGVGEVNLFWYENPGWERHEIAVSPQLDVGSTLADITGDGTLDVVCGQGIHHSDVYWFEQPDDPRRPWTRHLVTDAYEKYHDLAVGDVDDDGEPEVVGLSQESGVVFYYDIPDDPYQSPWPDACRHVVATDTSVEGVEIVDVDGDGRTEIVAGTSVYRRRDPSPDAGWERTDIATGWDDTRVAVADLDGDGRQEVIFAEGDSPHYGTHPGRVAWFDPPEWEPTFLREDLFCPHTLQVADFNGDGRPDIYVAEMGLGKNDDPEHLLFLNRGDGTFAERTIATGIETHEAAVTDLTGNGLPDIVGKSYGPDHHVDVWYNEG